MDHAADGLLALSTTAAALADNVAEMIDDDRSSSLSELEDAPENPDFEDEEDEDDEDEEAEEEEESAAAAAQLEADSEAETERLEESPDKLKKRAFGISPSKLAQSMTIGERPEIEALTDSGASSPISPLEDSEAEQSEHETTIKKPSLLEQPVTNKRKRLSDVLDAEDQGRVRRRRTGSIDSDEEKDGPDSENDDVQSRDSREATIEPLTDGIEPARSNPGDENEGDERAQAQEREQPESSDEGKSKKLSVPSRTSRRRKGGVDNDLNEADEENEAEESEVDVDADDAEAQVKSAEEQAKRAAAMEALVALEQQFAILRDRLYDERISQINLELSQLSQPEVIHPELQRQVDCVRRHRDQKFDVEQKLLVYKVTALKRKSIAERSQIHSAYFQSVRDIRERHLERISEQFYRIQRDRFKSNVQIPAYTIPFSEKRSVQVTQQMAYNKEVSILAGVAKYKGFPAAPELNATQHKEMEDDLDKMGISLNPVRTKLPQRLTNTFENSISEKVAGEQFLEQTPWANPQHPMNRLGVNHRIANKSPFNESYSTPTHQQKTVDATQMAGSASTIPEHPSQPASSVVNTPHDQANSVVKSRPEINGTTGQYRTTPASPTETRKAMASVFGPNSRPSSQPRELSNFQPSSPLTGRPQPVGSPKHTSSSVQLPEKTSRNESASPLKQLKDNIPPVTNTLAGRLGVR